VHEEWTDKLSDYLDGELAADERREVEAHVKSCSECAAVLTDLKRIVARAQEAAGTPRPPAVDLWRGIAARIETSPRSVAFPRRRVDLSRQVTFTLPQLAAAAALVAAVSGGIVWRSVDRAAGGSRSDAPATPAAAAQREASAEPAPGAESTDRIVPIGMADAQYDAAVADLEKAVKQGRGRLDASTIAIVEHNLQIIDQAIEQARDALATDPANSYLSGHLVEARRRKLDLLRRAAALSESD
jgi:anti-sigma factor RsiW